MILPIFLFGSPVLRQAALPVDIAAEDKDKLLQFVKDMVETMHKADGCGLAAPQVGVSKRILVVDGDELQNDEGETYQHDDVILFSERHNLLVIFTFYNHFFIYFLCHNSKFVQR